MLSPLPHSGTLEFAYRLSPRSLLCYGTLAAPLTGKEHISMNGAPALKPYLAGMLPTESGRKTVMILRLDEGIEDFPEISIHCPEAQTLWASHRPLSQGAESFSTFISQLSEANLAKLLLLLVRFSTLDATAAAQPEFVRLCRECRERLSPSAPHPATSFWLLPHILYLELLLPAGTYEKSRLLAISDHGMHAAIVRIVPLQNHDAAHMDRYAVLALFPGKEALPQTQDAQFALMTKDQCIAVPPPLGAEEPNVSGLIAHLMHFPEHVRLSLRDFLTRELMEQAGKAAATSPIAGIIKALQTYLLPTHASISDPSFPFGINIELAIPLQQEGLFISGWLHDPLAQVDSLVVTTDLGFSLSLKGKMQYYSRPDVQAIYEESAFPLREETCGFVALLDYPEELRAKLPKWGVPFAFRFTVTLTSGLRYTLAPKAEVFDARAARDRLLSLVASRLEPNSPAAKPVRTAARRLQHLGAEQATVRHREIFGASGASPAISVIIPLYHALEYVPVQVAQFANDPYMQEHAEVIYVLDAPQQERHVREQLRHLSRLYRFPLKLLVLSHNAGFARATNLGAAEAKSRHLLLLNSDVVPIRAGWLGRMMDCYCRHPDPNLGALAPKLLYEDDSIQHAGMFFAKNSSGDFFENLHYFKGYPASYPEACHSREVPAVTAACLLIEKEKFESVQRFSTEYIIGDFEDSDLCLRLYKQGLRHYYMAEEELYHFERQSMSALPGASSARYWLNAMTQQEQWGKLIPQVMEAYE